MSDSQMRTWAEVNLDALAHNYHTLRALIPHNCKFLGVVKANAYGHGAVPVAKRLRELGADYLAVACLPEAAELRKAGIDLPILILGYTPPEYASELVDLDITQSVSTPELAKALSEAAGAAGKKARVHLKLDTGMSRLGLLAQRTEEAARMGAELCLMPNLDAEGVFTHFAVSDTEGDGDEDYTMLQFTRFLDVLGLMKDSYGVEFAIRHCANSGAVLHYPCTALDMVRPGVALYGHYPDPCCVGLDGPGLEPMMTLKSRVAAVREMPENTPVSYGRTSWFGKGGGRTAVLPIGYADGYHRVLSNKAHVWLNGQRVPIMGRICMDMCMAALPPDLEVRPGDVAEIYGPHSPIEEAADLAGTIQYELLCAVAPRIPRIYVEGDMPRA